MRDSQSQEQVPRRSDRQIHGDASVEGVPECSGLPMRRLISLRLDFLQQVRLSELFSKASTFLYTETGQPKIAFLYKSSAESNDSKLATYYLTENDQNNQASRFDQMRDRDFYLDVPDPRRLHADSSPKRPGGGQEAQFPQHRVREGAPWRPYSRGGDASLVL